MLSFTLLMYEILSLSIEYTLLHLKIHTYMHIHNHGVGKTHSSSSTLTHELREGVGERHCNGGFPFFAER